MRCFFTTILPFSQYATSKRAIGLGEGLARLGHEVYIAAIDCDENRRRLKVEAPHCRTVLCRTGRLCEIWDKLRAVWRIRPDVFFMPSYSYKNLGLFRVVLPWRMKTVVEFAELYSVFSGDKYKWKILEPFAMFENNYILCASKYLKENFEKRAKRLHLNCSFLYAPYASPYSIKPTRRATSGEGRKTLLFMGLMTKAYGVGEMLEAFKLLCQKRNDVDFEVIGNGWYLEAVKHYVEENGLSNVVHFRGFVAEDELDGYFSRADVFVSPMHDTVQDWARCPSKLFHYLPYNRPIVTCKIGNPYDVLGEFGYYYRPSDIADMASVMNHALNDSNRFSYPPELISANNWDARAKDFEQWIQ